MNDYQPRAPPEENRRTTGSITQFERRHATGQEPPEKHPQRQRHRDTHPALHDLAQNRVWLEITALATDLLAWTQRFVLTGPATSYEPKRLRLRILAVAARLIRTARRQLLKIDPAWPWAHQITTAHARLTALAPWPPPPNPTSKDPEHRPAPQGWTGTRHQPPTSRQRLRPSEAGAYGAEPPPSVVPDPWEPDGSGVTT